MRTAVSKSPNYYRILGVTPVASEDEIRRAYRGLAKHYHPDTMPPEKRDWAREQMARINAAYQVLHNPQRRAEYDRQRGYDKPLPAPATAQPAANHTQRHRGRERLRRQQSQRWRTAAAFCTMLLVAGLILTALFARTTTAYVTAAAINGALLIALLLSLAQVNR